LKKKGLFWSEDDDLPAMMASAAVRCLWLVVVVSRGEDMALSWRSKSTGEGLVRVLGSVRSGIVDRSVAAVVMEEKGGREGGVGVSVSMGSELRVISNWVSSSSDWDCDS